jgi:hypothetical protein
LLGLKFLSFGFKSSLPAFAKMSEDKTTAGASKLSLSEEMHLGFLESMSKTNTEKIVKETLEGLSEDTGDSDSYDVDSGGEDSEDRPWRPSHSIFGKSTIKQSHLENMRGRYFRDISIVRADDGEKTTPTPEDNEVVIFRSFLKAGLRFPLSKFVVEVLKIYQIYLHQLTPEAVIRLGIFVWAVKSQGLEPSAKSFCNIHELVYETKPWGKEQYHNNFGCYSFGARSGSSCLVPTFRKRWPGEWMKEWFYVKNDLTVREDIKDIIMRPIWQRFGLRKPTVEMDEAAEECQRAFGVVCSFIGTRDLMQEHIAFRVWPLVDDWEMPKETIKEADEGGLIRLKYTFKYGDKFVEPDDDWLKSIENVSDELLGTYSKAENTALSAAFGGRKKKRLNRVFDAIGFIYPDYYYPMRGQKRKNTAPAKDTTSAAPGEPAPKRKKVKVSTHPPHCIEPATVPEFIGEASSATEAREPTAALKSEEMAEAPAIRKEKSEERETLDVISPSTKVETAKSQKGPAATPKRKRMVNVLDVLETIKSSSTTPKKIIEAPIEAFAAETSKQQSETEAGPSESTKIQPLEVEKMSKASLGIEKGTITEPILIGEIGTATPEASSKIHDYIVRHASGKKLSEEEIFEANHYARELKYPKGAVVFNKTNEDDFLYCLPDNKELSVCREMARSMGFPKLEAGLCAMAKEDLADSLAYNSLKV